MSRATLTFYMGLAGHIHISTKNTPRLLIDLRARIRYTSEAQILSSRDFFTLNPVPVERKESNLCAIIRLRGYITTREQA